jgi:Tfp pilus assembly protein PilF
MMKKRIFSFIFIVGLALPLFGLETADAQSSAAAAEAGTSKGISFARHQEYDKAVAEFTKAIKAQPRDPENYANRALAYKLARKPEEAVSDFAKVIELRSNDADAYANKGLLEVEQTKIRPGDKGSDAGD